MRIKPYDFGLLLGDGCFRGETPTLSLHDENLARECTLEFGATKGPDRTVPGIRKELQRLDLWGLYSYEKFIPELYLWRPKADRWALLQGYMDADGTVSKGGKITATTTSPRLRDDVIVLAESLGCVCRWSARTTSYTYKGRKLRGRESYRITIKCGDPERLFRLHRKRERCRQFQSLAREVKSVERIGTERARCISVAAPDGLYIAGERPIVTHNTYGVLLDPLRERHNPDFSEVIFRRTYKNVMRVGGLWDVAGEIYAARLDATPRKSEYTYVFPSGARVVFGHLENDSSLEDWKGAQPPRIAFDQLEEFTERQFFYMFSRLRSAAGIRPVLRATVNPMAESWLVSGPDGWGGGFISWWIDPATGLPIPERDGMVRWFTRGVDDRIVWGDTPDEVRGLIGPEAMPKSATFIRAHLDDNPALTKADPGYRANLMLLPRVERERLLEGNWKIRAAGGRVFVVDAIPVVREHPGLPPEDGPEGAAEDPLMESCLAWDYAASLDGDATAAVRADRLRSGRVVLWPRYEERHGPGAVKGAIVRATAREPRTVRVHLPQDPGGAGKIVGEDLRTDIRRLGYRVEVERQTGSKLARATPLSAACEPVGEGEVGRVLIYDDGSGLADRLVTVLHNFTGESGGDDDLVDAAADAFNDVDRPRGGLQVF